MFYFKSFESDTTQRCVRPANRYETDEFASERFVWSSSTGNVADPDKSGRSTRVPLTWNIFLRSTWTHFVDLIWKHSTGFFSTWKKKVQTLRNESAIFRTFDPSNSSARNFSNKMTSWDRGISLFHSMNMQFDVKLRQRRWTAPPFGWTSPKTSKGSSTIAARIDWQAASSGQKNLNISPNEKKRWSVSNWWLSYWLSIFGKRISKQEKQMWSTTL